MCLKALGMIQKQENWVPYELKPKDLERRFFTREQLLQRHKRNGFCIILLLMIKSEFTTTTQSEKSYEVSHTMHQNPWQRRISIAPSLCSVFGGINRVSCTTNCSNLTKSLQGIGIDFSLCV